MRSSGWTCRAWHVLAVVLVLAMVTACDGSSGGGGGTPVDAVGAGDATGGEDGVSPPEDVGGGDEDIAAPPEDVHAPPEDSVQPPEDSVQPPEDVVETPEDTIETPEDVVEPPEDVVETPEDVVETPEDVVETPEDVVEPPEDVVETPEDIVETPEDVVEPPEDVVEPPEDVVEPPEDVYVPPSCDPMACEAELYPLPPCQIAACVGAVCTTVAVDDGEWCNDGDPCTWNDHCDAGACTGDEATCDDGDPCTIDGCDPATGGCSTTAAPVGTPCDDGDLCTRNDRCEGGICTSDEATCDDGDPCTIDGCDPVTGGCSTAAAPVGTPCDDGDLCTWNDRCEGGICAGDEAMCDDGDPCTEDSCDARTGGCATTAAPAGTPCDDGQACTLDDACDASGWCQGIWNSCDDDDPCTYDSCDRDSGHCTNAPADEGSWCDDGDACTIGDSCRAGACVGDAYPCGDGDPCTEDRCDPETGGCAYPPAQAGVPCDDFDECTVEDACDGAGGCGGQPKCDDGDICTNDFCDWGTCTNEAIENGSPCDDGDACTAADVCTDGVCAGEPITCDDADICTEDRCEDGACVYDAGAAYGNACDDGDACTLSDRCAGGVCSGEPLDCRDDNPCTTDACLPAEGCVYDDAAHDGVACDDGDACTTADVCSAGVCAGILQPGGAGCSAGETCDDAIEITDLPFGIAVAADELAPDYMYPCDDPGYEGFAGGDAVFRMDAAEDGLYRVTLHMLEVGWTTILYLTDGCPDTRPDCLGYGIAEWTDPSDFEDVVIELPLRGGETIWATVDEGVSGPPDDFELRVELAEARELTCDDAIDNDRNGLTDCDDPQCDYVAGCVPLGDSCANPIVIDALPFAYDGSTAGLTDDHGVDAPDGGGIACDRSPGGRASPDIVFLLQADRDGVYKAATEDMDGDPEGFDSILYGASVCPSTDEQSCLDYSNGHTNGGDVLWFRLERGESAYVILDGAGDYVEDAGRFHFDAWLERAEELDCGDGEDGDLDGDVDCDDEDCAGQADCLEPEICDDGLDNDGDRRTDCYDPDCESFAGCYTPADVCWSARYISSVPYYFSAGYTYDKEDDYVNPCDSFGDGDGYKDEVYTFTPTRDGRYRFTIDNPTSYTPPELDGVLYIVEGCPITAESLCHGTAEMYFTGPGTATPAVVDVDLVAGQTVYAVVDGSSVFGGYGSEHGWYIFSLVQLETVCDDGADDDLDGDIDCDDEDCRWAPGC